MRLNPHGDGAIYETMVRLTRGNEALLHPFIDSKGNFGKQYSRDMAYTADFKICKLKAIVSVWSYFGPLIRMSLQWSIITMNNERA